jgi:WD40 repeat protein
LELNNIDDRIIGYHKDFVGSVCISKDEKFVISGGWDSIVKRWSLEDPN